VRTLRAAWRVLRVVLHVLGGMLTLALRFPRADEAQRHLHIQAWSAGLLRKLGLTLQVHRQDRPADAAQPLVPPACLMVCNHVSWLDIVCVHAILPQARFVSKADIRSWPLMGWMVAAAGTLFIERERKRDALRVVHRCAEALQAGHTVAVFPEGTTGTGAELLPFHANLLQSAISVSAVLQPLALRYSTPTERHAQAAAYTGDTHLLQSLWRIVSASALSADLTILSPVSTHGMERRALADRTREDIQSVL
jgi:1-acyl-sn-glycerol-3-phosphate acyltransferase